MIVGRAYRIFTVSKLWVTVTAPHAAMPPAMNALWHVGYIVCQLATSCLPFCRPHITQFNIP